MTLSNISANFCAENEERRNPELHSLHSLSKTVLEIRLRKFIREEHVACMYIFLSGFTFAVKKPEIRHKLESCSLYDIILKQSSNILGEYEQIIVAGDSVKCTTVYRIS